MSKGIGSQSRYGWGERKRTQRPLFVAPRDAVQGGSQELSRVVSSKFEFSGQRQYYIQHADIAKVKTACQNVDQRTQGVLAHK
jgi:hypothetical protein